MKNSLKKALASRGFRAWCMFSIMLAFMCGMNAYAANDPIAVINNLSTFMFSVIRAIGLILLGFGIVQIGLILLGFGIVQIGLSLKGHDPSQRANGFMTLAGGVIIMFAKEILELITK